MRSSLAVSSFVLVAAPLAAQVYRLPAIDSVSIARQSPNVFADNRMRAYQNPTAGAQDVVGVFKFDTSVIPDNATIASLRLILWLERGFNSPYMNPVVDVHRSADDAWTRSTATPVSAPAGPVVCANQQAFAHPSHAFPLNLAAHNFAADLADDRLTLVIDNVATHYSYVYFFGHTGTPAGPNAELEVVVAPRCGAFVTFGRSGRDSRGTPLAMLAHGCAAPGQVAFVGATLDAANQAPLFLWLGASDQTWGAIPLPLDLSAVGAPNNWLQVSLDLSLGNVPHTGGGAARPVPIPNDPSMSGASLFFQVVALDAANPFGFVASNGLRVTFE